MLTPLAPSFSPIAGVAATSSSAPKLSRLSNGRRMTPRTTAPQKRPSCPLPMLRPMNGTRSAFTRSPSSPSSAGSRVRAASTETMPTAIAATARLFITFEGTSSIPLSAITNTEPLKSTARLAVAPAAAIASSSTRPLTRSSR